MIKEDNHAKDAKKGCKKHKSRHEVLTMSQYVYIRSEGNLFTVGFYDPEGKWHSESDHTDKSFAARRVNWLNGGPDLTVLIDLLLRIEAKMK